MAGVEQGFPSIDEAQAWLVQAALRHRMVLMAAAYAVLRNWPDAEDVLQEAFLTAHNKLSELRDPSGGLPWLRRIVHLKAMEAVRARQRHPDSCPDSLIELAGQAMSTADEAQDELLQVRQKALRVCLAKLDQTSRTILEAFYWEGASVRELSNRFGKGEDAMRMTLTRIRKRLKVCIDRRLAQGEQQS